MSTVVPVSRAMLWTLLAHQEAYQVPYVFGKKAPTLNCDASDIHGIDCSGEVRWLLYRASSGQVTTPDGSFDMRTWAGQRLSKVMYNNMDPTEVHIAFIAANPVGHVWLVHNGHTLESYGHHGPGSRPWDTPILRNACCACYKLPSVS